MIQLTRNMIFEIFLYLMNSNLLYMNDYMLRIKVYIVKTKKLLSQ